MTCGNTISCVGILGVLFVYSVHIGLFFSLHMNIHFFIFVLLLYAPLDYCHPFHCNCACEGGNFSGDGSLVPRS